MTIPAFPERGSAGCAGWAQATRRNSSRMIGGCPGASTASAAAKAGPQVRLGGGWNCDPSQTTSGEATAEGDESGDDRAEDVGAHPATPAATSAREITSILIALRTGRQLRFGRLDHLARRLAQIARVAGGNEVVLARGAASGDRHDMI